jgi:hypothetical protein
MILKCFLSSQINLNTEAEAVLIGSVNPYYNQEVKLLSTKPKTLKETVYITPATETQSKNRMLQSNGAECYSIDQGW